MSPQKPTSSRKSPQQDRAKITVDAILVATAQILTQEGYDKASTNRIADRAGVSIGSLYQYFANKDALMVALIDQHEAEMVAMVESKLTNLNDAPIAVVLREIVSACIAAHAVNPKLHQVLAEQVPRRGQLKPSSPAEDRITELLRAFLDRHQHQIHPQNLDLTVFILGCTVESLIHTAMMQQPQLLQNNQLEQEITALLLSYLTRK
jgi:AcrR family transcriptional regulator